MGQHADDIIDGFVDQYTGEIIDGEAPGYPRSINYSGIAYGNFPRRNWGNMTPSERKIESVRKELGALIKNRLKDVTSEAESNRIINECRAEINAKYGKGWRERGLHPGGPCDNKSNVGTRNYWTEEELAPFQNKKGNKK